MSDNNHAEDREAILSSGLFDPTFYLDRNRDVAAAGIDPLDHYLQWGGSEGRRPHLRFDGAWYRRKNPDVGDMNPLVHYLRIGQAEGRRIQKHAVVYTAIIGGYDRLRSPIAPDPDLDYIVFADDYLFPVPDPWIRVKNSLRFVDNRRTSRYFKTHPHKVLPGYELSVWMDGAFQLRDFKADNLEELLGSSDIAFFQHPYRDCTYEEAAIVTQYQLDSPERIAWAVNQLTSHGYQHHAGLVEAGLIIRRHGAEALVGAMEDWWQMILNGSQRDQLSINFVLWKHRIQYAVIPGFSRRNRWVYWMGHRPTTWNDVENWAAFLESEILDLQNAIEKRGEEGQGQLIADRK